MNSTIRTRIFGTRQIPIWRLLRWGCTATFILTLVIVMQLSDAVKTDKTDFLFAIVIIGIVGGLGEMTLCLTANRYLRAGAILAFVAGFIVFGLNLAVGMIGSPSNGLNLLFGLVLMLAIIGAWLSYVHRYILPCFMLAAGTVQASIGLFAGILGDDVRGGILTVALSLLWWVASCLFLMAGKSQHLTD